MSRNRVGWAALVISLAALVSSRYVERPLPATQEIPEAGQKTARELSDAFNAVAEFVRPSVVQINVEKKGAMRLRGNLPGRQGPNVREVDPKEMEELFRRFFGPGGNDLFRFEPQQSAIGTGSGFIYDNKGHIITNNHVVEGADKIVVTFHDGASAPARIVGSYAEADVAVLQVDNTDYRPLRTGTTKGLRVGDWVLAVGSPFGLSQTVTAGIISATERDNLHINRFESFLQTDASINPGNSGGPLVDLSGRVVGVNSAIATMTRASAGVGFAIPIDMAARLADKLIEKGKIEPALMGVVVDPLNRGIARQLGLAEQTEGVLVVEVGEGSPAEKAGLKVGDIITSFDNVPVRSRESLQYLVQTSDAGKRYAVTYLRDGQAFATTVTPAPLEEVAGRMRQRVARVVPSEASAPAVANPFGIAVTPLTPELASKYGYAEGMSGLVVSIVEPGSPAEAAGIEVGDLITRYIKNKTVTPASSVADFEELVASSKEISIYLEDVNHRLPGEFKTLVRPGKE